MRSSKRSRKSEARWLALVLVVSACGGGSKGPPDAAPVTMLNGGFTPMSTVMTQTPVGCSPSGLLASGKLDAFSVAISDADLRAPTCGDFNIALPHALLIEVATGGYFTTDPNTANEPIVAGTSFAVLNEGVSDEDLCGNVPSNTTQPTAIAMFELCPTAGMCAQQFWATSGSVTVTAVSPTAVAGTLDLTFGDGTGGSASDGGTITGTFGATTCP